MEATLVDLTEQETARREFNELIVYSDGVTCSAIIIFLRALADGATARDAIEAAAQYFDSCPGYETKAQMWRAKGKIVTW